MVDFEVDRVKRVQKKKKKKSITRSIRDRDFIKRYSRPMQTIIISSDCLVKNEQGIP